ncbi:transcriptional regulator ATRX [Odontomachus brunneus]|uniref:transcriptional regulator ATRX n=1 Tax=Odontomachus brunneus TaxID=486640 RepID=UPI0013F29145|nr:transcriptional regulator ATRX [Odontomachus brunneus]
MDISSMLEVQVKEVRVETNVKENGEHSGSKGKVTSRSQGFNAIESIPISIDEHNYYQVTFGKDIASVRYRRLHCTACDVHIGSAPSQSHNMLEHPVLRTLLCARCREFYGDGTFEQGDDATDMFCRWCANGGNLYCCSYCSNTFCYKCIRRNFVSRVRKKIEADEKWQCFVCNPADLYDMRAVCWALLRHIQTVTSILRNEKNMSPEMIKEKMNLDESECCPRRSKRKQKRRQESNSEDEDESYIPKINGIPIIIKRKSTASVNQYKKRKLRHSAPNGTKQVRPLLIPYRLSASSLPNEKPKESKSPFPQNEPAKIDCQEAVVKSRESTVTPPQNKMNLIDSPTPTRYESSAIPPSLYHTAIINQTAASTTYIRPAMMNSAFHQIILPAPPPVQKIQTIRSSSYNSSQSLRNSKNSMVSISKPIENRSRPQLIFPTVRTSEETLTPNIIDLDSDSDDEPKIVKQHNSTNNDVENMDFVDISSDKIIPVALFSTENDNSIKEDDQPLIEVCTTLKKPPPSFSDIMLTHNRELDTFLENLKENMHNFFTLPDNETVKDSKLAADQKIKLFHKNMRETVFQLAHINDRVIREYNKWERSRKTETETSSTNQSTVMPRENIDIPLNMTCVNESDTESDYDKSEYQIIESSDNIKSSNILEDLLLFEKNVKHCSVGNSAPSTEDKAIQVYDILSKDYEKCISYSLLTKAHYEKEIDEDVLEPAKTPNESYFDKYQEQFIFYLQHIEDYGIETEDMKGLENPDKTFKESKMPDSPGTLESRQNINLLTAFTEKSENCDQEESSESCANFTDKLDVPANTADIVEIAETNSDCNNEIQITSIQPAEKIGETMKPSKVQNGATTLNNDDASSSKNANDVVSVETAITESEDCTIIED